MYLRTCDRGRRAWPIVRAWTTADDTRRARLAPDDALPQLADLAPPWPGRAVTVDGTVTYVRETPATATGAEPALYVHGLGGSSQNWTDLAALLAHRLEGEAIDLPGFGRSDPARRYTIAALAERVVRWIEHSDRGPVHLLGNSLGGTVTVQVAATRPDLVRTLTLVSPALPFLDPRRTLQARALPLLAVPRGKQLAARYLTQLTPEEMTHRVIAACFADPGRVVQQRLAEAIEETKLRYRGEHQIEAYLKSMRSLVTSFLRAYLPGEGSLWRAAGSIQAPTLVISGRQDKLVDIRVGPQTAAVIPDSRLLVLDGCGHVPQLELPRTVARAVLAMLAEAAGELSPVTPGRRWRLPVAAGSTGTESGL